MALAGGSAGGWNTLPPLGAVADIGDGVALTGVVGSYLFLRESTGIDACGAHPSTGVEAFVWDAARDVKLEPRALASEANQAAAAARARASPRMKV